MTWLGRIRTWALIAVAVTSASLTRVCNAIRATVIGGELPCRFPRLPRGDSVFDAIKEAEVALNAINDDLRCPPAFLARPIDAIEAARIVGRQLPIAKVQGVGGGPQISDAIIGPVTIDVVDLLWLRAVNELPDDAVLQVASPVHRAREIAIPLGGGHSGSPCHLGIPNVRSSLRGVALSVHRKVGRSPRFPAQFPRLGAIIQAIDKGRLIGQWAGSHVASPISVVVRPARCSTTVAGRPFPNRITLCSQGDAP